MASLDELKAKARERRAELPPAVYEKYLRDFAVAYTHESTAIEGNTLSLRETALLLVDGISVGGNAKFTRSRTTIKHFPACLS